MIMTSQRLYYDDPYATQFEAELVEQAVYNGAPAVVLDRTCFYPTSGGQPYDTGHLNDVPVIDVVVRESDGAVLHVLGGKLPSGKVSGQIDWARRFDHMRHHTGQHILSQAFIHLVQAETIGFHMSPDSVTIDLNISQVDPAVVDAVEDLANQIVADNRPVRAWFPSDAELETLRLRKVPDVGGKFRVVDIDGFDVTACGGTHVARTGEIGIIKVLRTEKHGDTIRVEFRCGDRALRDYRQKNALMNQLAAEMTVGYWEVPAALERLREENKTLRRELRTARAALSESQAEAIWQAADRSSGMALVVQAFDDRDAGEVRDLVQKLITHPATIALCGAAGEKAQLIIARSDDLHQDMVPVLMYGLAVWGVERGGGRPSFAQGGGIKASLTDVQAALAAAAEMVRSANR
jgi:alanyl-tRNA synthetase